MSHRFVAVLFPVPLHSALLASLSSQFARLPSASTPCPCCCGHIVYKGVFAFMWAEGSPQAMRY